MNKIKIAHCIYSIDKMNGGPSRSVPLLCKALSEIDVNVELITYDSPSSNKDIIKDSSVIISYVQKEKYLPMLYRNFWHKLHSTNCQILHGHNLWLPFNHWMAKYAQKNNIPYILTPRGCLEPWCLNNKRLKKHISLSLYQRKDIDLATCICATGDIEAENIRKLGFKNPIAVIPNGIDINAYPYYQKREKTSNKQVLFLSRLHPKKGIELLIEAWNRINKRRNIDWKLIIVGNGENEYVSNLKKIIHIKNLENSVSILPPAFGVDKIKMYHNSDLFILPTYSENFGMVIAEAMSCGTPVITTKNTPWEILEVTNSGWWIDLSIESIQQTIEKAISLDHKDLIKMGENGRKCIVDNFSLESTSKKTKELYSWVLGETSMPSFVI